MRTDMRHWWVINRLYHCIRQNGDRGLVTEQMFIVYMGGSDNVARIALEGEKHFTEISMSSLLCRIMRKFFFDYGGNLGVFWNDTRSVIDTCASNDIKFIQKMNDGGTIKLKLTPKGELNYSLSSFIIGDISSKRKLFWLILGVVWTYIVSFLSIHWGSIKQFLF